MRSRLLLVGAAVLVTAGAVVIGCSNDKGSNPYNPGPGGGTTLNLSLPATGGSASFTFNTAGTFPYKCGIHGTMVGDTVKVDPSSSVTNANVTVTGTTAPGFSPPSVTVKVGGTVQWTNPTSMLHTVVND